MKKITFEDLGLDETSIAAVAAKGFETPTPIQTLAIPRLLTGDANLVAKARTGTGKTAAFALPLIQKIREKNDHPRALVLTPTRELALQVAKETESLSGAPYPRVTTVYGGQAMGEQLRALKRGTEIVVGTPGRVMDHLKRGSLKLNKIDFFILDEADEMLDMGFIDDIASIFSEANDAARVLLFSATMPPAILKIATQFMGEYEIVEEEAHPEEPILTEQFYWLVRESDKIEALVRLIDTAGDFYGLVFTQTKVDADSTARTLDERGYQAAALHGDIPQNQREKILSRFRSKKTRILVATDVAARGIDIEGLTHVVNYALPFDGPTYIHRIGRTGRAGAKGQAFTFVRPDEQRKLEFLKQAIKKSAKGVMNAGKVPSVSDVLAEKQKRLFANIKTQLQENAASTEPSAFTALAREIIDELSDSLGNKSLDGETLAGHVLELAFGRELDPERYGAISEIPDRQGRDGRDRMSRDRDPRGRDSRPRRDFRDRDSSEDIHIARGNSKQMRLYVGLGRRDGTSPREIAAFFGNLLGIPGRLVDRIEITENFSLASLPYEAGLDALEKGKHDHSLPHMHIDSKPVARKR